MTFRTLSKSDFKAARDCPTRLYYRELGYPSTADGDEYLQLLAEGGYMVEELARLPFTGGVRPERTGDPRADAAATAVLMAQEDVTLFEGTFLSGRRLARVDILRRKGSTIEIFEVKASLAPADGEKRRDRTGSAFRSLTKSKELGGYPIASDWLEYLEDVAFQTAVLRDEYPEAIIRSHLVLIDPQFRATLDNLPDRFSILRDGDGRSEIRFSGDNATIEVLLGDPLTLVFDVTEEVAELEPTVRALAQVLEASLGDQVQRIDSPLGVKKCKACEFRVAGEPSGFRECWGAAADGGPLVLDLYKASAWCDPLLAAGKTSLDDAEQLLLERAGGSDAERQLTQIRCTRAGQEWFGEAIPAAIASAQYPLHFVDFETSRLAVPYHIGMRPYGLAAFQWSVHTITMPGGKPQHREWINDEASWPNLDFVKSLREALGDSGTILAWASHERSTLRQIRDEIRGLGPEGAELAEWIEQVVGGDTNPGRILDLNALTLHGYFHPGMGGRTSIKVVLDALWRSVPELRARFESLTGRPADMTTGPYGTLPTLEIGGIAQDVADGTGAMRAYQAMMYSQEGKDPITRAAWSQLLRQYCELDTLAMVLIWEHWVRAGAAAQAPRVSIA